MGPGRRPEVWVGSPGGCPLGVVISPCVPLPPPPGTQDFPDSMPSDVYTDTAGQGAVGTGQPGTHQAQAP